MIIEAVARFACAHRYIAQLINIGTLVSGESSRLLLVCERCGHRVEQLPLPRPPSFGRVIAFPSTAVDSRFVTTVSDHNPDPPPLLTA